MELGNLQAARLSYGVMFQGMTGQDWINESANVGKIVQFLNGYGQSASDSSSGMPARDGLTNLPLDDQGRYSATVAVGGELHRPKFFSCATMDCMRSGANLDMSDPATQAYVKAVDQQIFKDIGTATTVATLIAPVGSAGAVLGGVGIIASAGEVYTGASLSDKSFEELTKRGGQWFFENVLLYPTSAATRAVALIDLAGGWESFVQRAKSDLFNSTGDDN